jgi:hypothetical protein
LKWTIQFSFNTVKYHYSVHVRLVPVRETLIMTQTISNNNNNVDNKLKFTIDIIRCVKSDFSYFVVIKGGKIKTTRYLTNPECTHYTD